MQAQGLFGDNVAADSHRVLSAEGLAPHRRLEVLGSVLDMEDGTGHILPDLTAASSCESLSSHSSSLSLSISPKRSIFRSYWEANKHEQRNLPSAPFLTHPDRVPSPHPRVIAAAMDEVETLSDISTNSFERKSSVPSSFRQETRKDTSGTSAVHRRAIFGGQYRERNLPVSTQPCFRRASSTSALGRKAGECQSCLRSVQGYSVGLGKRSHSYGGRSERHDQKSECEQSAVRPSVSFSPQVSVYEFDIPWENYSKDGWSKLFP